MWASWWRNQQTGPERGTLPLVTLEIKFAAGITRYLVDHNIPGLGIGIAAVGICGSQGDGIDSGSRILVKRGIGYLKVPTVTKRPYPRGRVIGGGIKELDG